MVVHGLVLAIILSVWMDKPKYPRTISLDFSILNFDGRSGLAGDPRGERHGETESASKKISGPKNSRMDSPGTESKIGGHIADYPAMYSSTPGLEKGIPSDKDGQTEIYGKPGSGSGEGDKGTGIVSSGIGEQAPAGGGYGGGEGRTVRYGTGSPDEKTFHYIRDGVMKHVKYPERARRKGLTGRILISFMVSEAGRTHDVKVINSSGFIELDNSAKDAVVRATFSQKIPYKILVILPIEYRLE
jgi:protein TonB